ncbi:MAG: DUF4838 domain-containing protein [Victivallaceae bacterium]|nr:DUF4838 domain-containing protein [Victivallaceae bacterium]
MIQIEGNSNAFLLNAGNRKETRRNAVYLFKSLQPGTMTFKIKVVPSRSGLYIDDIPAETRLVKIVLPAQPNQYELKSAAELKNYLEKIFGTELNIVKFNPAINIRGCILLGKSAIEAKLMKNEKITNVAPDGYVISVQDGTVGITGYRGLGTLYGTYAFLERMGVRYFSPNLPRISYYRIPAYSAAAKPFFEFRAVGRSGNPKFGYTPVSDVPDLVRLDPHCRGTWDHTSDFQCPRYKYLTEHPEYFAKDSKGDPRKTGKITQLCVSDASVRKIAVQRMIGAINTYCDSRFFMLTPGDGYDWCECEHCQALDPRPNIKISGVPAYLTDRWLDYANAIAIPAASKYPGKILLTLAYGPALQFPPFKIRPEKNIKIMFAPYPTYGGAWCQSHDLFCPRNKEALNNLKGWLAAASDNIYIYDYPANCNYYVPAFTFYAMVNKIKFYHFLGIKGINLCGLPLFFRPVFEYVIGKLLWNPDIEVEPYIDEVITARYGNAAPYMRNLFNLFSAAVYNMEVMYDKKSVCHQNIEHANPGIITPELASKAYRILKCAKEAAKLDKRTLSEIKSEELYSILLPDLTANTSDKLVKDDGNFNYELLTKLQMLYEVCKEKRIAKLARRSSAEDFFEKIFGLCITANPWYNDKLIIKLVSLANQAEAEKLLSELRTQLRNTQQSPVPEGIELKLTGFKGNSYGPDFYSYNCPKRKAIGIDPQGRKRKSSMFSSFYLDKQISRDAVLKIEALDDDKPGATKIQIMINGNTVFAGQNQAKEKEWTELSFKIPVKFLKRGKNKLAVINLEKTDAPFCKWFLVSSIKIYW